LKKTCQRCHEGYEGTNRSKYCDACAIEIRREKKANYQRKRRFEKKLEELKKREYIKVSELPKYEGENKICAQIREKLLSGDYWNRPELTRAEINHIASGCEKCQRLWAKYGRGPRGLDLFHAPKEKDKSAIQQKAERHIKEDFPDLV
jgi:hypothetical protein